MFFTRTHKCHFKVSRKDLMNRLIGEHVKIHNMDFEIREKDQFLEIIPHAEQTEEIKTLPVAKMVLKEEAGGTQAVITFKMRKFDSGGPQLIIIFCSFMLIAAAVLFMVKDAERSLPLTLAGISTFILILFSIRMQNGYFDYIRKIRAYVKTKGDTAPVAAVRMETEEVDAEAAIPVAQYNSN